MLSMAKIMLKASIIQAFSFAEGHFEEGFMLTGFFPDFDKLAK